MLRDSHPHNPHRRAAPTNANHVAAPAVDMQELNAKIDLSREALEHSTRTTAPLQATKDGASADLAVSKYVAETEKNLDVILHRAGDNSSILLFDEADALFSKRTHIEDAHDKY